MTAWSSSNDGYNRSNSSTGFGSDEANGSYWQWHSNTARGGGFYIDIDKNIGEEYTIGLKFSFENTLGGWRKIIDYKNSTVDTGFYFYNGGHLNFYNYGVNGESVTQPNQVVDLIVRRNKATKQFEAYVVVNGNQKKFDMSITDSSDQGVPAVVNGKTRLGFFFDDIATSAEATPGGKVYNLKIWDKYMDPDKVIEALLPNGHVNVHHIDEEGDEVLPDETVSGKSGKPYSVKPQDVYGYEYLRAEGAPTTGNFPDSDSVDVTFRYKCLIPYTVTARYVDQNGRKLCDDVISKGEDGKPYRTDRLEIEDYDFVRVEGSETGTYRKKPQLVTYVYQPEEVPPSNEEGVVTAIYVDESGTKINGDMTYKGYVGTDYQTSQLYIPGYTFKETVGAATGTYKKTPTEVKYVYTKKDDSQPDPDQDKGGSVIVRYQDDKGFTIGTDVVYNGKVGAAYIAERKEIPKYIFEKVIGEESGQIGENVKVITMVYLPLASNVVAQYVDHNGIGIANTKIYFGGIGKKYQTEKIDIDGYRFVRVEGKETGTFSEDVQVVKYVYRQIGAITVKFVDLDGKPIQDEEVHTEFVDTDYQFSPPDFRGYEFVRTEGTAAGKYTAGSKVITHIYEKINEGTVNVRYIEEESGDVIEAKELRGRVGRDYSVPVKEIHGYEYLRTEGQTSGTYSQDPVEITFYYKLVMANTVTARYVDESGKLLCEDIVYKGLVDREYRTSQLEIKGYDFVRVTGEERGRFKKQPQLVTYVYAKSAPVAAPESGMVKAVYVDEAGNRLYSTLSYRGILGSSCKTSSLTMQGYTLKEVRGEENTQYSKTEQTVTYVYSPKGPDEQDPPGEEKGGTVIVKYQTEDGLTIRNDDVFNGHIGDGYTAVRYQISGYRFKRAAGPFYGDTASLSEDDETCEKGQIEEPVKTIIMYYEPGTGATSVVAKYVDEDGNMIRFDDIYNGFVGDSYQTEQKKISGYKFLRVEGSETGTFTEDVQTVTYVYKKSANFIPIGRVVIRFVDEDGNIIKEAETLDGIIGERYQLTPSEIAGYKYVKVEGDLEGVFAAEDQEVFLIFKKTGDDGDKPDQPDKPGKPEKPGDKPGIDKPGKPNKKPDINIDTDGDGIPDLDVDTDGDGIADTNIDTDGDGIPDKNVKTPAEIEKLMKANKDKSDELPWWIPKTGDTSNMLIWLAGLGAAVLALVILVILKGKKNRER